VGVTLKKRKSTDDYLEGEKGRKYELNPKTAASQNLLAWGQRERIISGLVGKKR